MKNVIIASIILASTLGVGCSHSTAPVTSPTTPVVTIAQAQKVIAVLDVLRDTAVAMNAQNPPLLSNSATAEVVKVHASIVAVIAAGPTGWKNVALTTLLQLQVDLPAADYAKIAPYVIVASSAIAAVQ